MGLDQLPGKSNYFLGADPRSWYVDVHSYAAVVRRDVYPGIDVIYRGPGEDIEYDFVIAPRARPAMIAFSFDGSNGVEVNARGDLVVDTPAGIFRQRKPVAYQELRRGRHQIPAHYVLRNSTEVAIELGPYDRDRPLVIDPTIVYSTYLGDTFADKARDIAVDSKKQTYLVGDTMSPNFPTAQATQPLISGPSDVFVAKLDSSGSNLLYSTFLGGSGWDEGHGIAVDKGGNAYITGRTNSTDFPTKNVPPQNPLQPAYGGGADDAFVAKLDASGSLVYSTYLGGSGVDYGLDIACDGSGAAYVTGLTTSTNFPTQNPIQASLAGGQYDAFVCKLNPAGSALVYSTYLGGSDGDHGTAIGVDLDGRACVAGATESRDFLTVKALQPRLGGLLDSFVAMLSSSGSSLVYSTYLGGTDWDIAYGIAVERQGSVYVTGMTSSTNFPTVNPLQPAYGGGADDAFVAKLNSTGSALIYSTFLGGSGFDAGHSIAFDSCGNAYVTGMTTSANFPVVNAPQASLGGGYTDAFVAKLDKAGSTLVYSTYLGGSDVDSGDGVALPPAPPLYTWFNTWFGWFAKLLCLLFPATAHVAGSTWSTNFPTANPLQANFAGTSDAFVVRIT